MYIKLDVSNNQMVAMIHYYYLGLKAAGDVMELELIEVLEKIASSLKLISIVLAFMAGTLLIRSFK